jgi:hypothetical protein
MTTYKFFAYKGENVSVMKFVDGEFSLSIPFDPANTDYQAYLAWLAEGNTPQPADQPAQA